MSKETLSFVTPPAEKLQNFFGVFLQFHIGVDMEDMRNESLQKGMKEGMEKGTLRILKTDKYALEEILDIYGLSLDEIKKQKD